MGNGIPAFAGMTVTIWEVVPVKPASEEVPQLASEEMPPVLKPPREG
jgi:hypothetical protein